MTDQPFTFDPFTRGPFERIRRAVGLAAIACIIAGAIYSAISVTIGEFSSTDARILFSWLVVVYYSTTFFLATHYYRTPTSGIALAAMGLSIAGIALALFRVWFDFDLAFLDRLSSCVFVLAGALMHSSLMHVSDIRSGSADVVRKVAVGLNLAVTSIVVLQILFGTDVHSGLATLVSALILLLIGATIAAPLMNRVSPPSGGQLAAAGLSRQRNGMLAIQFKGRSFEVWAERSLELGVSYRVFAVEKQGAQFRPTPLQRSDELFESVNDALLAGVQELVERSDVSERRVA